MEMWLGRLCIALVFFVLPDGILTSSLSQGLVPIRATIYSVESDPRAGDWPPSLPSERTGDAMTTFIPAKLPLLNVTIGIDLASPHDLSLVDLLLYRPLPMHLEIVPVWESGNIASQILAQCFETIYASETDRERVRDFLRALDKWTWAFKQPEEWTRVTERSAALACQVFTKDIDRAKSIIADIHSKDTGTEVDQSNLDLPSRTAIVNGMKLENVTIDSLLPVMLQAQSLYQSKHDEL